MTTSCMLGYITAGMEPLWEARHMKEAAIKGGRKLLTNGNSWPGPTVVPTYTSTSKTTQIIFCMHHLTIKRSP